MITIHFSPIEILPDEAIRPKGPVSMAFLDRGPTTFQQAAHYVRRLPYGHNRSAENTMILFDEGFGTCLAKHGIIARLAEELGLNVQRYEGFYPLTGQIVTGVDAILAEYGLPYIPRTHCFLSFEKSFIDLTEGNCTGKNGLIEAYFEIFQVKPEQTRAETDLMIRDFYAKVCEVDPNFARLGIEGMLEVLQRCVALNTASCGRMR